MVDDKNIKRRAVIKTGLLAAAGTAATGSTLSVLGSEQEIGKEKPSQRINKAGEIPTRRFGNTGMTLPILGMGGSALLDE